MAKKKPIPKKESDDIDTFVRTALESWKEVSTPIRPSQQECDFYENYVRNFSHDKNKRILVLGATPELRDIALRYSLRPASCDVDSRIWEAMKFLMKEQGEEKFIYCDWLKMSENDKYDIILGDGSINMLSNDDFESFIQKTAKIINEGGLNIQRIGTHSEKYTVEEFSTAVEAYRENNQSMSIWRYTVMLACAVNSFCYPKYNHLEIYEKVLFRYLTEREIEEVRPFISDRIIFFPERENLKEILSKYFKLDRIEESKGIGCWGTMHTYVMRKK